MNTIAKFSNQRTVTITSSSGRKENDIDKPYGVITRKEELIAFRILDDKRNTTPIMLFIHLTLNQNGYKFDFSPAELQKLYGVSSDRWRNAFGTLVKKGYLVPDSSKNNHYIFYSLPEQYKNITILDNETEIKSSPADEDRVSPPTSIGYPYRQVEDIPADKESNNKNIINSNIDIINNDISETHLDSLNSPEQSDNLCLDNEKEKLLDVFNTEFGHIEDSCLELIGIESKVKRKNYRIEYHIKLIEELIERMRNKRRNRKARVITEYKDAVKSTLPKDTVQRAKINLILDRCIAEYSDRKIFDDSYGVWINGWNEEMQEPNLVVALYPMPLSVLKKQRHNLDGIPSSYYKKQIVNK